MIKAKVSKSLPIVGGVQGGHAHLNPSNHASAGIVASMPMGVNESKFESKKFNARKPAMKALTK